MRTRSKFMLFVVVLAALGGAGFWAYTSWTTAIAKGKAMAAAMGGGGGARPMPVVRCETQDVTNYADFTGTTEAINAVEIRARIRGYLQAIHFTDGSLVEKGQLLFTIEPEAYTAQRDEAQARLDAAEAELERARVDLERIREAAGSNAVSKQELSLSQAAYHTAEANVSAAQAALDAAQLDLSYTQIRSPIRGRASRHRVDVGNLVGAGEQTLLTTVVQTSPIYVSFYAQEGMLREDVFRQLLERESPAELPFQVGLADERDYSHEGVLNFLDNRVDPSTGTVYVRGEIANEDDRLLPGMYVRTRVPLGVRKDAVLLDEKAICTDLDGKYVLAVGEGNKLERRKITAGRTQGGLRVITDGLDGSELCLSGSFTFARAGMPIVPMLDGQPAPEANSQAEMAQGEPMETGTSNP